ncbi:hypothetical protein GCM10022234_16770 [Aeromicrobium panaciterrae]|uniref:YybH family protein n=1 Tax=Aeromicrobium panaciterrae TaxID=363861 RepID=UPI0031E27EBE
MTAEDEVRAVSAAWDEAITSNDADLIASFMTDDWVYVGPQGPTPKEDLVGWIASGRLAHFTMKPIGDDRILQLSGVVVFTARKASTGRWDGAPYEADEWISEVYVPQGDGRWLCALSHKVPAET